MYFLYKPYLVGTAQEQAVDCWEKSGIDAPALGWKLDPWLHDHVELR